MLWIQTEAQEAKEKKLLKAAASHWQDLVAYLEDNGYVPEEDEEEETDADEDS